MKKGHRACELDLMQDADGRNTEPVGVGRFNLTARHRDGGEEITLAASGMLHPNAVTPAFASAVISSDE